MHASGACIFPWLRWILHTFINIKKDHEFKIPLLQGDKGVTLQSRDAKRASAGDLECPGSAVAAVRERACIVQFHTLDILDTMISAELRKPC